MYKGVPQFLWLDMEMSGLDPEKEVILEVATIVTDSEYVELDSYDRIIKQDSSYLEKMDKWNTRQHKKSGLYEMVTKGIPQNQMELELIDLVNKHFDGERVILAGNSIYQDRLFIKKHLLEFEKKLHYRMLDVSAWKIILKSLGITYKKQNKHRALDDIRESIQEMKEYFSYLDQKRIKEHSNKKTQA